MTSITRALISTADKTGLIELAKSLVSLNIEIIATGNTAKLLQTEHIPVIEIAHFTGHPEILGGRVKTLHPKVHGGILARRKHDKEEYEQHQIQPIDLVIVNLYPFEQTIAQANCRWEDAIEQIDIGGPTMLRAAAKNHQDVTVITDPQDYPAVLTEIKQHGNTTLTTRKQLALKVFTLTTRYDAAIAQYFESQTDPSQTKPLQHYHQPTPLRYGENPHQTASLYRHTQHTGLAHAQCLHGKALSYNNLMDGDAALQCVSGWQTGQIACAIIKHATPCGVAVAETTQQAYQKALATDPVSAFGGIIAFNHTVDQATAELIIQQFAEVIIAPGFTAEAQAHLQQKINLRILICNPPQQTQQHNIKSIDGGLLVQSADSVAQQPSDWRCVTKSKPSELQQRDLNFAWQVVKQVKSNAIVYAKQEHTLGIGTGQTSRVFSARIAALKAEEAGLNLDDAVMASDAFFPFADGIEVAANNGISAIIQPGGSKRDQEVIDAANHHGISMIFTGHRHFKH